MNIDALQLRKKTVLPAGRRRSIKPILVRRESPLKQILLDEKDVTPKPLRPELFISSKERHIGTIDITSMSDHKGGSRLFGSVSQLSTIAPHLQLNYGRPQSVSGTMLSLGGRLFSMQNIILDMQSESAKSSASSLYHEVELDSFPADKPPTQLRLILNETETFFVLDIPSYTEPKNSEEGDVVEEMNKRYEYLTSDKGRNRKVINVEVQTAPILKKTRSTEAKQPRNKENHAFASEWDMFDTYFEENEVISTKTEVQQEIDEEEDEEQFQPILTAASSIDTYSKESKADKEMKKLVKNPAFLEAVCVTERILANNCFGEQQKRFCGLIEPDLDREEVQYSYSLKLLWTFANQNLCVNTMEWNPKNKNLLAVGYGKFYYQDKVKGLVLVWNIKNPVQPERQFNFEHPVTILSFSKQNPNVLAVAFYSGELIIIDISERQLKILNSITATLEPIWDLYWLQTVEQKQYPEQICVCFSDGRVLLLKVDYGKSIKVQQIMRTGKAEGKLGGIEAMESCSKINIPVTSFCGAKAFTKHPSQKDLYYISSARGVINLCSTFYMNQQLEHFKAHHGPINGFTFSPFCPKIFATCGDDWYVRVWASGISEPLLELYQNMESIAGIDWSPVHSTILVSVTGKNIVLWDLQRKVYEPQSVTVSPANAKCTCIQFVESGRCLVVGDIKGNVQVFSVENMPFPSFFQENLLFESLEKALITKPDLIYKLNKIRRKTERITRN